MRHSHSHSQLSEAIVQVSPRVYTAVGMAISNVSMIIGDDGVIIVDTGVGKNESERIAAAFRGISDKPVAAVIYTHSHPDHIGGAASFLGNRAGQVPVWARSNFGSENSGLGGLEKISMKRAGRQFGVALSGEKMLDNQLLPPRFARVEPLAPVLPTHTFSENEKSLTIAGIPLLLRAAPGETLDQLCTWLPEDKVLFTGDTMYRSFPNLYAIRGTPYRDIRLWADSLDMLLGFNADAAVLGHTMPAIGNDLVREMLTNYRDAIRHVYSKTLEAMNLGLTPDELAGYVQLPAHLAEKEYLAEFYGSAEWAARSVFSGLLGWFDGNPRNLVRMHPKEEASRLADLAGGQQALLTAARAALEKNDCQWAAQLADALLHLDSTSTEATTIQIAALTKLGENLLPITGRNYILSCVEEIRNKGEGE